MGRVVDIGTGRLQARMKRTMVPRSEAAVLKALEAQERAVLRAIREHWDTIVRLGPEATQALWWPAGTDAKLATAIVPAMVGVAQATADYIAEAFGGAPAAG